jgi:hypothetical protein
MMLKTFFNAKEFDGYTMKKLPDQARAVTDGTRSEMCGDRDDR